MSIEIRPLRGGELDAALHTTATAFGEVLTEDHLSILRRLVEPDRMLVAAEGESIVASTGAATFQITVPGGVAVPCAGITLVATLPTHRRRGLSRALIRQQLEDLRERGDPLAYLWASEAAIYQRFGWGMGALVGGFEIRREMASFLHHVEPRGRIRLADRAQALKIIPEVYERVRPTRPGMLDRPATWLEYRFRDDPDTRHGFSPMFFAIHETTEGPHGYVAYRIKEHWTAANGPAHELEIEELVTATDDAYAALWRYCLDVDLVRVVKGWKRPVDEPLLHMLVEPRAFRFDIRDGTWIRLVDVATALESRRYSHEGRIVLELDDEFAPWNDDTYQLDGGPEGATCRPSSAEPDLSMRVEDLAAAYLGAVSFRSLASAGRVTERSAGALETAGAMFSSSVAPWCPWIF